MEELLKNYLNRKSDYKPVEIINWKINGSECFVEFHPWSDKTEIEKSNINIWDMIVFLNTKED